MKYFCSYVKHKEFYRVIVDVADTHDVIGYLSFLLGPEAIVMCCKKVKS